MNKTQYWLSKLAEEAAEISQDALKAQQFGLDEVYPKTGETNLERLRKEVVDFMVSIDKVEEETGAELAPSSWQGMEQVTHAIEKSRKINYYLDYAISIGSVVVESKPRIRSTDPECKAKEYLDKREAH